MAESIFSKLLPPNMQAFAANHPNFRRSISASTALVPGLAPVAAGVGLAAGGAAGFGAYQNRQRDPDRLARRVAGGDQLTDWQKQQLSQNPELADQYSQALQSQLEGAVRFGGMNPQDAQRLQQQTSWSFDQPSNLGTNPYSPNVQGAGSDNFGQAAVGNSPTVNDYRGGFGANDYSAAGVPDPQSYALQRDYLSQSVIDADRLADTPAAGNFRREMNYVRPLERDRNLEGFAMEDTMSQRNLQRQQALKLADGYMNMIQNLRI